jgi:hypothetical protein
MQLIAMIDNDSYDSKKREKIVFFCLSVFASHILYRMVLFLPLACQLAKYPPPNPLIITVNSFCIQQSGRMEKNIFLKAALVIHFCGAQKCKLQPGNT